MRVKWWKLNLEVPVELFFRLLLKAFLMFFDKNTERFANRSW
jgi:hypothetical protein